MAVAPAGRVQPIVTVVEAVLTMCNANGALGSADAFVANTAESPLPKLVTALTRNV